MSDGGRIVRFRTGWSVAILGWLVLGSLLGPVACRPDPGAGSSPSSPAPASGPALRARLGLGHPVVVEVTVDRPRVVRLQPFTLHLSIYVRNLPAPWEDSDPFSVLARGAEPVLTLPWLVPPAGLETREASQWLQQYLSFKPRSQEAGFHGFRVRQGTRPGGSAPLRQLLSSDTTYRPEPTRDGAYHVFRLTRTFRPVVSGRFAFQPVRIQGEFAAPRSGRELLLTPVDVRGPRVVVQVDEPPKAGRPAAWNGGIDLAEISARAEPTRLAEGEPLTLTLAVRGDPGALRAVRAVHMADQPRVLRDFQVVRDDPEGRLESGEKRFEYVLRPRRPGIPMVPSLAVATFDLELSCYRTLHSAPIALAVSRAGERDANPLASPPGPGGIHPNITDASDLENQAVHPGRLWLAAAGLVVLYAAVYLARWGGARLARRPARIRGQRLTRIRANLAAARMAVDPERVVEAVRRMLVDVDALPARDPGHDPAESQGTETGLDARLDRLRSRAEGAVFAGGSVTESDAASLLDEADAIVRDLAR